MRSRDVNGGRWVGGRVGGSVIDVYRVVDWCIQGDDIHASSRAFTSRYVLLLLQEHHIMALLTRLPRLCGKSAICTFLNARAKSRVGLR